jgi:hypothetical protein
MERLKSKAVIVGICGLAIMNVQAYALGSMHNAMEGMNSMADDKRR